MSVKWTPVDIAWSTFPMRDATISVTCHVRRQPLCVSQLALLCPQGISGAVKWRHRETSIGPDSDRL